MSHKGALLPCEGYLSCSACWRRGLLPLILTITCLFLAGCMLSAQHRMEQWTAKCTGYGFTHGTPAYAQCVQAEELAWQRGTDAALGGLSQSLNNLGQSMQPRPALNCTTYYVGTMANTRCY